MNVIPTSKSEQVAWFDAHAPVFAANAANIGLTTMQTALFTTLAATAHTEYLAAQAARAAAKAATIEQDNALRVCHGVASELVKTIRAFAQQNSNPNVYALAQIPAPAAPSPVAPVNPSNVEFALLNNGALELKWDGLTRAGTSYLVFRSVQTEPGEAPTPFVQIGNSGERKFIDTTIPPCTAAATYVVKAMKGGEVTPGSEPATARFSPGTDSPSVTLALAA